MYKSRDVVVGPGCIQAGVAICQGLGIIQDLLSVRFALVLFVLPSALWYLSRASRYSDNYAALENLHYSSSYSRTYELCPHWAILGRGLCYALVKVAYTS